MGMLSLAESHAKEFSAAVQQQEQHDAEAIAAISDKMNRAYAAYSSGLESVREKQMSLGEQYRACLEAEGRLQNQFEREMQELHSQLAAFKHRREAGPTPIRIGSRAASASTRRAAAD